MPIHAEGFTEQGSLVHDNLIAGEFPRFAELATITGTGTLTKGTVLGHILSDDAYRVSTEAAADGSQAPSAILAQDVDLSAGDVQAVIYLTGEYNSRALVIGDGHTLASIREPLRENSIFLRENVPAQEDQQ